MNKIENIAVEKLIPYARNSRTHSDEQVAQIAGSIREFGFTNPVLIDAEGTIIAGHGRVMAARKLELEKVPCIRLTHLTPTQVRAYVIADNKLALNAGWNEEMLKAEMEALKAENYDQKLTGFSDAELSGLFLEIESGITNADDEWEGMPEYEAEEPCFRKVVVNFDTAEDVSAFFKLLGQNCTDKTKSVWYPEKERRDLKNQQWAPDENSEEETK
jgi:hypothetical protein